MTLIPRRGSKNCSGGSKAPRWPNGNIDWQRVLDEYLKPIITGQIAPNTNRGFMYILESKRILKKSDYDGLTDHLVQWRQSGEIRWDDVADGSGRGIINDFPHFQDRNTWINNKIDFLRNGGEYYKRLLDTQWRWFGQPEYVMKMVEKHAVAGTVAAHTVGNYVKVAYNRGDSGWGYMEKLCRELETERYYTDLDTGKEIERDAIYLKYMGDEDKYGRHMDELIKEQLEFFEVSDIVEFERIAVIPSQIQEYGLPVDFETGKGYEIDALNAFNAQKFKRLLLENIIPHFDEDIHEKLLEQNPAKLIDRLIRKKIKFLPEHSSKHSGKPKR
jgi:hypothetical protein